MRFLRLIFIVWICLVGLSGSLLLAAPEGLVDRLAPSFLNIHASLPFEINLFAFLILLAALSVAATVVAIFWCLGTVAALKVRSAAGTVRESEIPSNRLSGESQPSPSDPKLFRQTEEIEARCNAELETLDRLSQRFREKLDKRHLVEAIVESTQRLTSTNRVESAVGLWLLDFKNDTFSLERGLYCDKESFLKPSFPIDAWPFSEMMEKKHVITLESSGRRMEFLKEEKVEALDSATGFLIVPLVVEGSVLGVLSILCNPEVLNHQKEREGYFTLYWSQLAMALAISVQGELAMTDRLTGARNRTYFLSRFDEELNRANRYGMPMTFMMIDIDDFKPVNDTLGHLQGDAVLKIVAQLLRKSLRMIDMVARYGGEEFVLLLPETGYKKGEEADPASSGVGKVAERVRSAIENEFEGMKKPLNITVSIGVVVRHMPEDRNVDVREMIRRADKELYRAKVAGKNQICYYSGKTSAPENGGNLSGR